MKKMMFLLMMICLSANSWAQTASGNCGLEDAEAVIWEYDATTTTLSIYGIGKMADYNSGNAPWNAYISSITSVVIESGVTSIGSSAFSGCSGLTSVSLPYGVTSIGSSAFQGCSGLTSVSLPYGVTSIGSFAFQGCSGLTSVSLPYGVTSIGSFAFQGCSGLTSVSLPYGVTSIGSFAFQGCSGLTSVSLPYGVTSIGSSAFSGCSGLTSVSLPYGVTSIGSSAFSGCSGLTSVSLPYGVTSIGSSAFSGCSGLTSVSLPYGVTSIGSSAFQGCSGLTSVSLPYGVTSIGSFAFQGCSGLTSIIIPSSVTTIGSSAFSGCSKLTSVSIPIGVTSIGNSAFSGCLGLTSVSIPNGVTSIGNSSFSGCSGLTSVSLPNGVTTIGESTFSGCSGLTSVSLPNSVTSIGNSAFSGCSKLTSVSIPSCVTSIGNSAFQGCSVLTDVYYNKTAPIVYSADWQLGSTANPARTLHIPSGATDAFNNNGWTTTVFASISQGFPSGKYVTEGSDLSWVLVDHTLTIFGTGKIADYNSGNDPWSAYHSSITSVVIESGVTSIGNSAFSGFSALMSISIPVSVTSIGEAAFSGCSALTSVSIPNNLSSINNHTFNNCSSLTSVSIPNSVISIARYAFAGCSSLTSVSIPNNITSIEDAVFEGCSGLTTITVGADNTAYRSTDKEGKQCNALLTYDGKNLIKGCNNTTIPSDVTIIGGAAFTNCSALTSITIPNSLTELSSTTFAGCSALTDVYYASTNPTAYISNWNLGSTANPARTLHIPSGATDAFNKNGCTTTVFASISDDIPAATCGALNSNVSWMLLNNTLTISGTGKIANYNSGNAPWSAYRSSITRVVIESGVTSIGNSAFSGLSALTSVSIPESVTYIGESAFSQSGLASVNIPENVTDIGAYAFQSCLVTSVNIPKNVTNIESGAFNMCFMLETITVDAGNTAYRSTDANGNQCNALLSEDGKTLITGCKNTTIPSDVTTIVESAFSACLGLTAISIPSSVTSIEDDVFTYCSKITTITVDAGNTAYRSTDANSNQCNALLSKDGKTLIAGCKNTTIPIGVTSIGTNAFNGCSGLTSVSIPGGVTGIGDNTFWGCSTLANVYYNTTTPITYCTKWELGSTSNPTRTLHVPVGATAAFSGWTSDFAAVKYDIVDATAETGLVYTGSEQTGVQAATEYNTVTDGAKTDAGKYTATASLTNPSIHVWPDGTTADKTIAWSIAQATNEWTTEPSIADYAYGTTPSTPAGASSFGTPEFGYYTEEECTNAVDLTNGKPAPGTYYMKAATAGTGNYTALSSVVAFHITNQ